MNYDQTLEYLFNSLPMYHRIGKAAYKADITNTVSLMQHLGHPERRFRSIHVAGTNGKGSVSHFLASVLMQAGYKVGLYTSPHLVDFRERIRINGAMIPRDEVTRFVELHKPFMETLQLSFFEMTVGLAFDYFASQQVDIAVVEVGMGGRLDSTNVITPLLSIITNIGFDHTQFLGNTLAEIAGEKAGIIKKGVPVIIGESNEETRPIFEAKAREMNAPIVFAEDKPEIASAEPTSDGGMLYHTPCFGDITGDLGGIYQQKNLNTVFFALNAIARKGFLCECKDEVNKEKCLTELLQGIAHVKDNTGLMGRWQVIQNAPKVVCDTGHNVGGWQYISAQLSSVNCQSMHIIFGMVDDKDINGVLDLLPKNAQYYFTKANNHRALSETVLSDLASKHGLVGKTYPSVYEAYNAALSSASHSDFIFVGGSSYVVGDFLKNCL